MSTLFSKHIGFFRLFSEYQDSLFIYLFLIAAGYKAKYLLHANILDYINTFIKKDI